VCDVARPWEHGTEYRFTALPDFFAYNLLTVDGSAPVLGVDALVHAADMRLGELAHRRVDVEDAAVGERLRPGMEALGWTAERLVWMRLASAPPPPASEFTEVPVVETRPLRLEWTRSSSWARSEATRERWLDIEERAAAIRGTRALVAGERGRAAGYVLYVVAGDDAEIDQVYVRPGFRGRGTGGALVAAAVRAAGAARTFIVADDEGDPKRLYSRLGFEPVWIQHVFTRRPG
jgi:ribosomal protein S18 acetylase RimI-like enzyme